MATFKQGQEQAYHLTEKDLSALWGDVLKSYDIALENIDADIARTYAKFDSLNAAQKEKGIYNYIIQRERLDKLKAKVRAAYNKASIEAGRTIIESSKLAITNTFYREQYTLNWFTDITAFTAINQDIVNASVFGTAETWKEISKEATEKIYGNAKKYFPASGSLTERLVKNRTAELSRIQETITDGLIRGVSYKDMTKSLAEKIVISKNNASRIIRTEATRNMNAGALASYSVAEAEGIELQKVWVATLDATTRGSHQSADGQKRNIDEDFNVNGAEGQGPGQLSSAGENINCRCTTITEVDGISPELRRGRNPATGKNEVFSYKDFNTWAKDNGMVNDKSGVWVVK